MQRRLRAYCRTMFLTIGAISAAVALLNWLVDPYDVYCHSASAYFRPYKRRLIHRVSKAEIARRGSYDVLLIGDSRIAAGYDADHPALTQFGRVYNLSVAASSVYECSRMLELALERADSKPKLIIWGISSEFVVRDRSPKTEFDFDASLLNPQISYGEYHLRNLLSLDATRHTLWTVSDRMNSRLELIASTQTSNGGFTSQAAASTLVSYETFVHVLPSRHSYLAEHKPLPVVAESEALLRDCFRRCRERGIELKIVIPPVHAVYLERMYQMGLSERIEMGKRVLVRLATESNSKPSSAAAIEIWDFSGFRGPTTEAYATATTPAQMHWYQDALHFRTTLGNLTLTQMFGITGEAPEFGVRLTEANVEDHLISQREARKSYQRQHADHVQLAIEGPVLLR